MADTMCYQDVGPNVIFETSELYIYIYIYISAPQGWGAGGGMVVNFFVLNQVCQLCQRIAKNKVCVR